jgi:rhamnulokinase
MAYKNYLVLDFGASNGRSVVCRYDGKKFVMEVTHRFNNIPVFATGTLYWDILGLYSELIAGIQASVRKYGTIVSTAVSAWGADFGFIDKNRKLISNPVNYRDEKRLKNASKLYEIISARELFNLTGALVDPIFDLFHLYSLKLENATEFLEGDKFLTIPDIFNYFLTGETYNEYTRITGSIMFSQKEGRWEDKIFKRLGLRFDIFPEVIKPGIKIGNILDRVSSKAGIEEITIIAPASHDTASAVAGIPLLADSSKNWAFIIMGTWCIIGQETEKPIINDRVFDEGFSNEGGVEGLNLFFKNINGLWIIQQCRDKWNRDGGNISWDEIVRLSSIAKPFKSFIDVSDPVFLRPQTDMPGVIKKYCKDKNQDEPESIGEIARCVYESLSMKIKDGINKSGILTGKKIEILYLVGGGIQNKLLCQWISDATGIKAIAGPVEATSVGNLIMQLKASGEIKTLKEGRKISLNSSVLYNYEPEDKNRWDREYDRYIKIFR